MGKSLLVKAASGGHESRMPSVLNIIALATFAASLSARALAINAINARDEILFRTCRRHASWWWG